MSQPRPRRPFIPGPALTAALVVPLALVALAAVQVRPATAQSVDAADMALPLGRSLPRPLRPMTTPTTTPSPHLLPDLVITADARGGFASDTVVAGADGRWTLELDADLDLGPGASGTVLYTDRSGVTFQAAWTLPLLTAPAGASALDLLLRPGEEACLKVSDTVVMPRARGCVRGQGGRQWHASRDLHHAHVLVAEKRRRAHLRRARGKLQATVVRRAAQSPPAPEPGAAAASPAA